MHQVDKLQESVNLAAIAIAFDYDFLQGRGGRLPPAATLPEIMHYVS
jgi:hypothetical protein